MHELNVVCLFKKNSTIYNPWIEFSWCHLNEGQKIWIVILCYCCHQVHFEFVSGTVHLYVYMYVDLAMFNFIVDYAKTSLFCGYKWFFKEMEYLLDTTFPYFYVNADREDWLQYEPDGNFKSFEKPLIFSIHKNHKKPSLEFPRLFSGNFQ